MGLLNKAKQKQNEFLFGTLVKKLSGWLAGLCGGMPLDVANGEKEAAVMLSPRKDDTAIYLVALNERGAIVRVAAKYSGAELAAMLMGKLKAVGVDLNGIGTAGIGMVEPLNDLNDERIG